MLFVAVLLICIQMVSADDVYCATEIVKENAADPCGDMKGQSSSGLSFTIEDSAIFSYATNDTVPEKFLGCAKSVCEVSCEGLDTELAMDVRQKTGEQKFFCFSGKSMFMQKDRAAMSAISRGCSGTHEMSGKYMHGEGHMTCDSSYTESGVDFVGSANDDDDDGSAAAKVSPLMSQGFTGIFALIVTAIAAVGLF